ncbi:MAG: hypothetical protein GX552_09170 [Chloroflexi bacterium]|jgi:hypothetical protein|nr:hypothetical protein [Chloroflexota bacterium]
MTTETAKPYFSHRACYVNFAEHLQNAWNVNMFYPGAPNRWSLEDWRRFFEMIKAFGFNCFEYWLPPTLYDRPALAGGDIYGEFAANMRQVNDLAHELGLKTKFISPPNTIGPRWFFACPHTPEDMELIRAIWSHWTTELAGTDIMGIFPGDPGGCNRNGCTHETFVDLALELAEIAKRNSPTSRIEVGTWGTPFTGWGSDMWPVPGWDGSWEQLIDERHRTPEMPVHIWNGKLARAHAAMDYFLRRLPAFPEDTMVAINLGFSPDGDATMGGDGRAFARAIAEIRPITTWDYSLSEGELVTYPHWRLPRMAARRREERSAAPYIGGMSYTMTPRLNLLTMYAAGQLFVNPDADPDALAREFAARVFGPEHAILGELFEAFEVVQGWGHYPRRQWSREALYEKYGEIIERLEAADMSNCTLPLCVEPEAYRQDLLWFARRFHEMAGPAPDRERIRREYWDKSLHIYDVIPMSADERAEMSATRFAQILAVERLHEDVI